jgi:tetrahydromethanopterin S-methyltransferase subunit B
MSEQQTITIDNEEHNVSDLTVETQMHVARVAEIRQEIARLQMQINERQVVLNAYGDAIVNAVKPAEDEEPEAEVVQ